MKQRKVNQLNTSEPDTLTFHKEMYQRRLRKLKERGGLSEKEIADHANNPALYKREPESDETGTESNGTRRAGARK